MVGVRVSAIVLAGGRSTRFGADKLAARLGGETLLERAVGVVAGIADEVIVVEASVVGTDPTGEPETAGGQERVRRPRPEPGLDPAREPGVDLGDATSDSPPVAEARGGGDGRAPVRIVRDTTPDAGPLAGLRDGAAVASGTVLLVVAGDMPTIRPDVLQLLVDALERDQETEAVILSPAPAPAPAPAPHPPVHPLPMALRRGPALDAATRLLAAERRSLRGLLDALRTTAIPAATWRALDPDGATLRDIDTPADLAALEIDTTE
jgi:molybdopterin-guanine dinucleotide biosynthesis protein A